MAVLALLIFSGALFLVSSDRYVELQELSLGDSIGYTYDYNHKSQGRTVKGEVVNGTIEASYQSSINLDVVAERETSDGRYLLVNRSTYTPSANRSRYYQFWLRSSGNEALVKEKGGLAKRGIWLRKTPPLGKEKIKLGDEWTNEIYGEAQYEAVGFKSIETRYGNITCLVVNAKGTTEKDGKTLLYKYVYYLNPGVPSSLVRLDFRGVLAKREGTSVRNISSTYEERVDLVLVDRVEPMSIAPGFNEIMSIQESEPSVERINREVKDFTLPTISGANFNLYDTLNERPVLLMFIATWCPHCHNETESLLSLRGTYGSEVQFVTFAVDRGLEKEDMVQFKNDTGMDWQIGDGRPLMPRYGVNSVPMYIAISQDGKIVFRHSGRVDKDDLQGVLNALS